MPDMSRATSPEAPPKDLWLSILDSVSSRRAVPEKQILILGEPSTGKTTIASAILQKRAESEGKDFLLGYDWCNVKDEADDDTILTRLSIYTAPSSEPTLTSLLPIFLPPKSALHHTAVVIVLDWSQPWTFIDHLRTWLAWIESWSKPDGTHELDVARDENREKLQYFLQRYTEPTTEGIPTSTSTLDDTLLPLGEGVFTHNSAGVPIIVVCTKVDLMTDTNSLAGSSTGLVGMMKAGGSEEKVDAVMQILRTICLSYGAALFCTTQAPETLSVLRKYILHLLFMPPAPSLGTDTAANFRNPFPFTHKANVLDRDQVFVPAGWDSAGKIGVVGEGFDAKMWRETWDADLEDDESREASKMFAELVPDRGPKPPELPPLIEPIPEQVFLAKHYEEFAKKPDKDPRGAFRTVNEVGSNNVGLVGPMGSSSFHLPSVEKILAEMDSRGGPIGSAGEGRRGLRRDPPARPANFLATNTQPSTSSPSRDASVAAPSSPGGQDQHAVLHNFFQSLLNTRERGSGAAIPTRSSPQSANAPEADSEEAAPGTDAEASG